MSQEEAQGVNIAAGIEVAGGEIVAESVGAARFGDTGLYFDAADQRLHRVGTQVCAELGQPEVVFAAVSDAEVGLQCLSGGTVDRDHPQLIPLAQDTDLSQVGVEVREFDTGQLGEAQAGIGEDGDDGLIPDAEVALGDLLLAGGQHSADVIVAIGLHLLVVGAGQLEVEGRVMGQQALLGRPVKEGVDDASVVVDGSRGSLLKAFPPLSRPAVLLGSHVGQEVDDVLPGDFSRWWEVLALGIPAEAAEALLVVVDCLGGEVAAVVQEAGDEVGEGGWSGWG